MSQAPRHRGLSKFLHDLFTGPDGETWAIGRVYSLPVLLTGLALPVVSIFRNQPINLVEAGTLLAGIGGAVVLLVRFNNGVDDDPQPPQETPKP